MKDDETDKYSNFINYLNKINSNKKKKKQIWRKNKSKVRVEKKDDKE
jgi:ligand-binding sensor protein